MGHKNKNVQSLDAIVASPATTPPTDAVSPADATPPADAVSPADEEAELLAKLLAVRARKAAEARVADMETLARHADAVRDYLAIEELPIGSYSVQISSDGVTVVAHGDRKIAPRKAATTGASVVNDIHGLSDLPRGPAACAARVLVYGQGIAPAEAARQLGTSSGAIYRACGPSALRDAIKAEWLAPK